MPAGSPDLVGRADGMAVPRAVGVESESELPFAAAHQVVWPLRAERAQSLRAVAGCGGPPSCQHPLASAISGT